MESQLKSACEALKVNRGEVMKKKKKGNNLFNTPTTVQMLVQFADNQALPEKITTHKVTLPKPMFSLENTDACLITRPPQRKVKDALRTASFPHRIERVIDIRKLRRKFKSYAEKEKLHKSYTLFLADSTITDKLPELLGRDFMFKAKMPVSVSVPYKPEALKESLATGFSTAMFHVAKKSLETTVGIGNTDQDESSLAQNGLAVIEYIKGVPEFASNIRSIRLKTQHSPGLLVYQNEKIVAKDAKAAGKNNKRKREEADATQEEAEAKAPPARKQKGENGKPAAQPTTAPPAPAQKAAAAPAKPAPPAQKAAATPKAAPKAAKATPAAAPATQKAAAPVKKEETTPPQATPAAAPATAQKTAAKKEETAAAAAAPATPKATPKAATGKGNKASPKGGQKAAQAPAKAAPQAARSSSAGSTSVGSPKPGGKAAWK